MKTTGMGEKERSEEARRGRARTDAERGTNDDAERRFPVECTAIACGAAGVRGVRQRGSDPARCRRRDGETTNRRREAMGERATKQDSPDRAGREEREMCVYVYACATTIVCITRALLRRGSVGERVGDSGRWNKNPDEEVYTRKEKERQRGAHEEP